MTAREVASEGEFPNGVERARGHIACAARVEKWQTPRVTRRRKREACSSAQATRGGGGAP
jgi:hypothetical protein